MKHVTDDEQYLEDWDEIQDKLEELQRKHNKLVEYMMNHWSYADLKEFLVEFDGEET